MTYPRTVTTRRKEHTQQQFKVQSHIVICVVVILAISLCLELVTMTSDAQPKRIPVGALFDSRDIADEARAAFRYQVDRHNNQSESTFLLDVYEKIVNVNETVRVIRAGCSTLSIGVFALLGLADPSTTDTIDSLGSIFHMPYVSPGAPGAWHRGAGRAGTGAYTVYLRPMYTRALFALIKHFRWTSVLYLYDSNEGMIQAEELYRLANAENIVSSSASSKISGAIKSNNLELDLQRLDDVTNSYTILRQLDARNVGKDKHIILDVDADLGLHSVLNQILQVGMHRADYHYILGGLSIDDVNLDVFRYGGVNISGFRLVDQGSPAAVDLRRDWTRLSSSSSSTSSSSVWRSGSTSTDSLGVNKISLKAALMMDAVEVVVRGLTSLFDAKPEVIRNSFRRGQLISSPNSDQRGLQCLDKSRVWIHGPALIGHLKNTKFVGLTGPVEFDDDGHRTNFNLDLISMTFDRPPMKIGTWNETDGLWINRDRQSEDKSLGGGNYTYIVTTLLEPPYVMLKKKQMEDGKPLVGNDRYEGFCAEIAQKIADIIKIDYVLRIVEDGKFGTRDKVTEEWNGMVGELIRWKADIAIAPLTISSLRERFIDFSKPFMNLGISIMIKKPEKQKPGVFSFMDPLATDIWLCIILSYLGVSMSLFLVSRFSPYAWQVAEGDEGGENGPTFTTDFTLLNSLWFSLGALLQQGCDISPRSMSGRLAGSSWWFFTLIMIASYTANLAAFLTVERMLTPIESADDLVKQTDIEYGTLGSGSSKDFFQSSNITVYRDMWRFMSSRPHVFTSKVDEGVSKVRSSKGKYAFLLESTMNDYYNQKKPCNTMKVGENLDSKGYGVATPLNHPLKERIGLAVLQLIESGELTKLHKKWWYEKGECAAEGDGKGGSAQNALTLSNVAGIFYILIGGLGLSMIVSLTQFLSKSYSEARRQKQSFSQFMRSKSAQRLTSSATSCSEPSSSSTTAVLTTYNTGSSLSAAEKLISGGDHGVYDKNSSIHPLVMVPTIRSSAVSLV